MPQCSATPTGRFSSVALACDCLAHRFANAADNWSRQQYCPTGMTDANWAAIRPLLPVPGRMRGRGGCPEASVVGIAALRVAAAVQPRSATVVQRGQATSGGRE